MPQVERLATPSGLPEPGQLVTVRGRRWIVSEIRRGGLESDSLRPLANQQHLVTLASRRRSASPRAPGAIPHAPPGGLARSRESVVADFILKLSCAPSLSERLLVHVFRKAI